MNTKFLFVLFALLAGALVLTACGAQVVQAAPAELPYGLTMQDTMAGVEHKFGQPKVEFAPQAGWEQGLPDEGYSPDHFHYWAVYKRFGVTVIYNSPSASDKSATIQTVLVNR